MHLTIEGTQTRFRAREILMVSSTESYRSESRIRLGTGAYRRRVPFPVSASPHYYQEGTNSHMANLHTSMVLSLIGVRNLCPNYWLGWRDNNLIISTNPIDFKVFLQSSIINVVNFGSIKKEEILRSKQVECFVPMGM